MSNLIGPFGFLFSEDRLYVYRLSVNKIPELIAFDLEGNQISSQKIPQDVITSLEKGDAAMSPTGGIDLNSSNMDLLIKRDGRGVPLPLPMQDMKALERIEGFIPNIIEIRPMITLPFLSELQNITNQTVTASAS